MNLGAVEAAAIMNGFDHDQLTMLRGLIRAEILQDRAVQIIHATGGWGPDSEILGFSTIVDPATLAAATAVVRELDRLLADKDKDTPFMRGFMSQGEVTLRLARDGAQDIVDRHHAAVAQYGKNRPVANVEP